MGKAGTASEGVGKEREGKEKGFLTYFKDLKTSLEAPEDSLPALVEVEEVRSAANPIVKVAPPAPCFGKS